MFVCVCVCVDLSLHSLYKYIEEHFSFFSFLSR